MNPNSKESHTSLYVWGTQSQIRSQNCLLLTGAVRQVSTGVFHTLIRTEDKLYGVGQNQEGQLGQEEQKFMTDQKGLVEINLSFLKNPIKMIACGDYHSVILDTSGFVYSCGMGRNGVLGYGRGENGYRFQRVRMEEIRQISAGKDHNLAISSVKVFGWGSSREGQLGLVKQKIYYEPQQLLVFASDYCYAGPKYSIFRTEQGVFGTGSNESGQLGLGHDKKIKMPKKINFEGKIVECIGCQKFILFKNDSSEYLISGISSFGHYLYPTKIKNFKGTQELAVCENLGVKKDQQGHYYVWNPQKDSCPNYFEGLSSIDQVFQSSKAVVAAKYSDSDRERECQSPANQVKRRKLSNYGKCRESMNDSENEELVEFIEKQTNAEIRVCSMMKKEHSIRTPLFMRNVNEGECRFSSEDGDRLSLEGEINRDLMNSNMERQSYRSVEKGNGEDLHGKIAHLENQNRVKDAEINKLRSELIDLVDMVSSDSELKRVTENMKSPEYLQKIRKQLQQSHQQSKGDTFGTALNRLKKILQSDQQSIE